MVRNIPGMDFLPLECFLWHAIFLGQNIEILLEIVLLESERNNQEIKLNSA